MRLNDYAMFNKTFIAPKRSNPNTTDDDIEAFKYTFSRPGTVLGRTFLTGISMSGNIP